MVKKKQKLEHTEEKIEVEPQKPLWFKMNKTEFEELTQNMYNNQNNKDFKIIINKNNLRFEKMQKRFGEKSLRVKSLKVRQKNCTKNCYKKALMH